MPSLKFFEKLNLRSWKPLWSVFNTGESTQELWCSTVKQQVAYKLKHWPHIDPLHKKAISYRALSLLSQRPVDFNDLAICMRGDLSEVVSLLQHLENQGALEIVCDGWKASDQSLQRSLRRF